MSGGDLDGDIYFVIWDKRLLNLNKCDPHVNQTGGIQNERMDNNTYNDGLYLNNVIEEMLTNQRTRKSVENKVYTEDYLKSMLYFITDYWRFDNLGYICNCHLVISDKEAEGINSGKSLQLAKIFFTAVDFKKNGVNAVVPKELRVKEYPDFMGKAERVSYKSNKILGLLYRNCCRRLINSEGTRQSEEVEKQDDETIMTVVGHENYLEEAKVLCQEYNFGLYNIMENFRIFEEGEVISGYSKCFTKSATKNRKRAKDDVEKLNLAVKTLRKEYRTKFLDEFVGKEDYEIREEMLKKASAWYKAASAEKSFKSFPWVVWDVLLQIFQ